MKHERPRPELTDEHLGESLRRLPEARAGEDFTRTVMARLEAAEASPAADREASAEAGADSGAGSRWSDWLPLPTPRLAAMLAAAVVVGLLAAPLLLNGPFLSDGGAEETAAGSEREDITSRGERQAATDLSAPGTAGAGGPGAAAAGREAEGNRTEAGGREGGGPDGAVVDSGSGNGSGSVSGSGSGAGFSSGSERLAAVDLPAPTLPPPPSGDADQPAGGASPSAGPDADAGGSATPDSDPSGTRATGEAAPAPRLTPPPALAGQGRDLRLATAPSPGPGSGAAPGGLDRDAALQRLARLRQRQERLRDELAALDATGSGETPALLLGGNENVELVLDLGPRRQADARGTIRPANWRSPGD